jgi:hypothetical protein
MRLNPQPSRFHVHHSELYEAGVKRLRATFPFVDEALENLEWSLQRAPYSEGERLAEKFPDRQMWWTVLPHSNRYPALRVLFEIVDPKVFCWHVSERH